MYDTSLYNKSKGFFKPLHLLARAQEGHLMVNAKIGDDVLSNIFAQRSAAPTGDFELGFIPNEPVNIDYQAPDLTINYEMDNESRFNFTGRLFIESPPLFLLISSSALEL